MALSIDRVIDRVTCGLEIITPTHQGHRRAHVHFLLSLVSIRADSAAHPSSSSASEYK